MLFRSIHADFEFDSRATTVATPLHEVMMLRRGVCQDFAHLMIGCLRSTGLAARYVSGYLLTQPPPGRPRLIGADASHAWVSVYSPEAGWLDLDPTNDCVAGDTHITLGWGRDFSDVTPLHEVMMLRRGVCQDFAHLMIGCLRSTGLAARYVSGYLLTQPPPGKPRLIGADASHAWVSVYSPEAGWLDLEIGRAHV